MGGKINYFDEWGVPPTPSLENSMKIIFYLSEELATEGYRKVLEGLCGYDIVWNLLKNSKQLAILRPYSASCNFRDPES